MSGKSLWTAVHWVSNRDYCWTPDLFVHYPTWYSWQYTELGRIVIWLELVLLNVLLQLGNARQGLVQNVQYRTIIIGSWTALKVTLKDAYLP